jgi:hypothetical protein
MSVLNSSWFTLLFTLFSTLHEENRFFKPYFFRMFC